MVHVSDQFELPLYDSGEREVPAEDVTFIQRFLAGQGWIRAKAFPPGWNERRIRAAANASEGLVISGQKGYRLTLEATIEEARKASAWLRHQATAMTQRAVEIERVYHRRS